MSERPDLPDLARRYIDLWQEHLRVGADDPEILDGLKRVAGSFGRDFSAFNPLVWQGAAMLTSMLASMSAPSRPAESNPSDNRQPGHADAQDGAAAFEHPPEGAAPAAAASSERGPDMAKLEARLALLEERLAKLERRA